MSEIKNKKWFALLIAMALFAAQMTISIISGKCADLFNYQDIDSYNVFAWISVHHIVQMILAAIIVMIMAKFLHLDFGFRIGDYRAGLKYVWVFSLIIFIYTLISYSVGYLLGIVRPYTFPLRAKNICASLGFQLLLSGSSEEILFRALPITILVFVFGKGREIRLGKVHMTVEVLISAFLFSLAHINWTLNPFSLIADYYQLLCAFIFGIFYGKAFQKSGSVLYPALMHGMSNFLAVGIGYLFAAFYPWK